MKQNVYVIVNNEGEFLNSISYDHVFWTQLPIKARLFENEQQAKIVKISDSRIVKMLMKVDL